tara:strand:- start:1559 stop:2074 length:516 start_codon:yes stop_codon:yes gene_type:complete
MALYFNSDDLLVRRVSIGEWICTQVQKLASSYHYGQLVDAEYMMNYQYVVALSEVVACYDPITTLAQDGVDNCLTEAELECAFNNISEITCIGWLGKNVTYRNQDPVIIESGHIGVGWTIQGHGVGVGISHAGVANTNTYNTFTSSAAATAVAELETNYGTAVEETAVSSF